MKYPENLKVGDTIGICAPSCGIEPEKYEKLDRAEKTLREKGYKIYETASVRQNIKGRSASAETRVKEFMELYRNPEVKLIIFATGGDFLCETFEYLNFEELRNLPPKWMQGYSDITGFEFLFNTILEIPSIYCQTIKDYAMKPLFTNLIDALRIASGEEIIQESYELYEEESLEENPNYTYHLTKKVQWKNLKNEEKIEIEGRMIGGCLDTIINYVGTKYDNVKNYISHTDGVIWYFDIFEMSTPMIYRSLWQLKNAGYFEKCNGIIFGRPLFVREDYGITYVEAYKDALEDLNIPIIFDADIGHKPPQLAIVNGGYSKIISYAGKGKIKNYNK